MEEMKKNTHGGKRAGAGRKRQGEELKVQLKAYVSAEALRKVKSLYGRGEFGAVLEDFIKTL